MGKIVMFVMVTGILAVASSAHAQSVRGGASISLLPLGTISFDAPGESDSADTAIAFGINGLIDYAINPAISIGFMPQVLLNVKPEDEDESAKQFDLLVRVAGHYPAAPNIDLYGYLAPGYSIISPPDWPDNVDRPKGLIIGFGGGAAYQVAPRTAITGELGYQIGLQGLEENGVAIDLETSYLRVGAGVVQQF